MKLQVAVERLRVEGVDLPPGQRPVLQAAVEAELARLLAEGGLNPALTQGQALPTLHASAAHWAESDGPAELGRQIARSVYGSLGAGQEKSK